MKKNQVLSFLLLSLVFQACGQKPGGSSSATSAMNGQIPLMGGSVTKEIIIRTNAMNATPSQIISGNLVDQTDYSFKQNNYIFKAINDERNNGLRKVRENSSTLIKAEYGIDAGVTALTTLGALTFGPLGAAAVGITAQYGGNALKGFAEENRRSSLEETISSLNDKRDRTILNMAYILSEETGSNIFKDLHAGVKPEVVKEKIASMKHEILTNSELSPDDIKQFMSFANDNALLGLTLSLNSKEIEISRDVGKFAKELKENKKLIEEVAKNTKELLEQQKNFFNELNKRFTGEEKDIILNAIFNSGATSAKTALLTPEQVQYFKENPAKLERLKKFDRSELEALYSIQEKAQEAYSGLKLTSQIASNLNLNSDVVVALDKGATVAGAAKSIASFAVTGNPLDALSAVASITGLFSKPKPDPRFTAIFENFKNIQMSLNEIKNQLRDLKSRIDNVDDGLKFIIEQNKVITALVMDSTIPGKEKCSLLTAELSSLSKQNLNIKFLNENYSVEKQDEGQKVDSCIKYLVDTFEVPVTQKKNLFDATILARSLTNNSEVTKYFSTANQMRTMYEALYPSVSDMLTDQVFQVDYLQDVAALKTHIDQLLNNSFLLDISKFNSQTRIWEIVSKGELAETVAKNKKTPKLLENALRRIEVALIQQSVIDGNIQNDDILGKFLYRTPDCVANKFGEIPCLAAINPTFANNMVIKGFRKLIGKDYFWAWKQVALNNPDFLNEKLGNTNLKVVWVGDGADRLYKGVKLPKHSSLTDGAYVQISGTTQLVKLPSLEDLNTNASLASSARVAMLMEYKRLIENELIERKIDQVLNPSDLASYNKQKIELVLQ